MERIEIVDCPACHGAGMVATEDYDRILAALTEAEPDDN